MKIFIIGLRKSQLVKLRKMYRGVKIGGLTDSDRHKSKIPRAESYDLVISIVKFTNHSTEHLYGKLDNYYRINGASSSLIRFLDEKLAFARNSPDES